MISAFRVPHAALHSLAAGLADPAALDLLRRAHLSRNLLLIGRLADIFCRRHPFGDDVRQGFDLLCAAQAADPAAVATVAAQPQVGVWATQCLRVAAREDALSWQDAGYLNSIAAAAAIHARLTCRMPVAVRRGGGVMLPTLGLARLATSDSRAELFAHDDEFTISADRTRVRISLAVDGEQEGWMPMRRLTTRGAGRQVTLLIDDLDPTRDYGGIQPAPRLTRSQFAAWSAVFAEAWELLADQRCGYATGIAAGLRSIVPLQRKGSSHRSATNADAFAAVAVTFTADPVELAVTLLHEFQHSKLAALLYLLPLHCADPRALFSVPWRDDLRPLEALLHGTYAFLATTDFWRVQRLARGTATARADREFARGRRWVGQALGSLMSSDLLTDAGRRFVNGMAAAQSRWEPATVPSRAAAVALDEVAAHWTLRNRFHGRSVDGARCLSTIELPVDAMLTAGHHDDPSEEWPGGPAESDERKWAHQ